MITSEYIIESWLSALDRAKSEAFFPLEAEDERPDQAWREANMWAECFFQPDANPFKEANKVRHSYHIAGQDTFDLLRHEYAVSDLKLVVTECSNFSHTLLHQSGLDFFNVPDKEEFISRVANTVLRLNGVYEPSVFKYPNVIAEGATFSTNPDADLFNLPGWRERADGVIRNGKINFLCYKKTEQRIGFRDDQEWFDEQFRTGDEERRRRKQEARAPTETGGSGQPAGVRCGSCDALNPPASRFCNGCGTALGCPTCGRQNPPGSRFCNNCGNRLVP